MAPQNKVLSHVDKDEVIRRLTSGESVRDVEAWLADKYPHKNQHHLRISFSTLQQFRSEFLNLKGAVLSDLTEVAQQTKEMIRQEAMKEEVRNTTAYREAITAIATEKLDTQRELIEIFHILKSRVEILYNNLQNGQFHEKQEKALRDTMVQMMAALENYKKWVEGHVDTTRMEVSVNVVNDQVSILREAVREVLVEMEPELAVKFMAKLSEKMRDLKYHPELHSARFDVDDAMRVG